MEPVQDRVADLLLQPVLYRGLARVDPTVVGPAKYILRYFYAFVGGAAETSDPLTGYAYPPRPPLPGVFTPDPNSKLVGRPWIELATSRGKVVLVDMQSVYQAAKAPYLSGKAESLRFVITGEPALIASLAQPTPHTSPEQWSKVKAAYAILDGFMYKVDQAAFLVERMKKAGKPPSAADIQEAAAAYPPNDSLLSDATAEEPKKPPSTSQLALAGALVGLAVGLVYTLVTRSS